VNNAKTEIIPERKINGKRLINWRLKSIVQTVGRTRFIKKLNNVVNIHNWMVRYNYGR